MAFDYRLNFRRLNFRENPELYRVGIGEQGVLLAEPYKSKLLPLWRFKTPAIAAQSARSLEQAFAAYVAEGDFAGMDMARKFLQMGYTRARRYANHASGKKYAGPVPSNRKGRSGAHGRALLPRREDPEKAKAAAIFKAAWERAEACEPYRALKADWKIWYG